MQPVAITVGTERCLKLGLAKGSFGGFVILFVCLFVFCGFFVVFIWVLFEFFVS